MVSSLNSLAELYHIQGNYAAAEPLYKRLLAMREKVLGPEHPDAAQTLNNLARLYRAQGNNAAAELLFKRLLRDSGEGAGGGEGRAAVRARFHGSPDRLCG